jgi:hypothetical protein
MSIVEKTTLKGTAQEHKPGHAARALTAIELAEVGIMKRGIDLSHHQRELLRATMGRHSPTADMHLWRRLTEQERRNTPEAKAEAQAAMNLLQAVLCFEPEKAPKKEA